MVAVVLRANEVGRARRTLAGIRGERGRLHFTSASANRRARLVAACISHVNEIWMYDAHGSSEEVGARRWSVVLLVGDALAASVGRLVIERDETRERDDQATIRATLRSHKAEDFFAFEHASVSEETLLALADTVAWCLSRDRNWRERIAAIPTVLRES